MTLLGDPTIQRILEEVNKAASGGVLGIAGSYISEPNDAMTQFESHLSSSSGNNFYNQDRAPLFYPTPDMFNIGGLTSFDNNNVLNSLSSVLPMTMQSNFDIYSTGLYNTMPQSFLSPYENCNGMTKLNIKKQMLNDKPMGKTSEISSTNNNNISYEHNRHQEYPTMPSATPNLGINIRTSPQLESLPNDNSDSSEIQLRTERTTMETKNTATQKISLNADNQGNNSYPSINNDDIDQQYSNSAGKIFHDPNPQIIQRKGSHSVTYKQNIIVRFLQPPPIPNAGPLIIKEIRAPQPSPLPPLVIKQRPTPPKTPPPIVIREKPPPLPSSLGTKVITRQLPADPPPPRAVIIERLPPLPAKPRDIIIERWLPYEIVNQKRKVIVQRAPKNSKQRPQPKNVIITYEPIRARIIRNFQKQSITREDPQVYVNRYGSQLFDSSLVVQQARAVGVTEDLSPPSTYISTMTAGIVTDEEYELPTATITVEDDQQEQNKVGNSEKVDENNNKRQAAEEEEEEEEEEEQEEQEEVRSVHASSTLPVHIDENVQEEDISVEENVIPFYMNSGENLQQTLHRLGIEIPDNLINEHNFSD